MSSSSSRFSMRDLRHSTASILLSSSSAAASASSRSSVSRSSTLTPSNSLLHKPPTSSSSSSYLSVPKRTLNIVDVKSSSGRSKTAASSSPNLKKESRRVRKKREWLARKARLRDGTEEASLDDESDQQAQWAYLPDLVLEIIFQMLPYEEVLDTVRASNALHKLAPRIRRVSFLPKRNLHTICSFQRMMTKFCEFYGPMPQIESFRYVFPCDFARKSNEVDIYGTGGMILQDMKELLEHLTGLTRLELIDLELDGQDASHILDEVSTVCCQKITNLILVNTSRKPFSLLSVASFVNLRCLAISPHNLGDDLVECIGDMPRLRNLQLITNSYTECVAAPVDYRVWKACRKTNPRLRVHLVTEGKHAKEINYQARAPVRSIVYNTPYTKASTLSMNLAVEMYGSDLECYAHQRLPRFHMAKAFHERPDSAYLYLVRRCPYIHTLMIRERISSSTVLLLAYTGKNLRYFHVRRNAVVLKCDWPRNPEWGAEFYQWLRKNSRSYSDMEREVSQILGFRWYALNDKQFKLTPLNLNIPYYYEGFEEYSG